MPSFFIDRPIFAWVVALFICLIGAISIPLLAVAQYPIIAPPSISISTSYPGASPENLYNSVTRLIEEELNGANGILNFESTSDSLGQVEIIANFVPGTDTGTASVEVQNRIKRVEARLPRAVIQQGILIEEASSAVLQIITLRSTDGSLDEVGLGDFMIRNVLGEIRRIPGVGRATLYSTERSLRIWIDPAKLVGYDLTVEDVNKAITAQNAQVASGSIGAEPSTADQKISALVLVKGQLSSPDEFGAIILRANADGSTVRLRDVARLEIGGLSYQFTTRLNGKPTRRSFSAAVAERQCARHRQRGRSQDEGAVALLPGQYRLRNSLQHHPVVKASIREGADDAGRGDDPGLHRDVPVPAELPLHHHSDHRGSGGAARHLRDAAGGGLFDQHADDVRHGAGDRHSGRRRHRRGRKRRTHHERGGACRRRRPPARRCRRSSSAIIGITLVLIAVFVPMAFFPGSVGIIYRQFSVTMVAAIGFSALLALSLTPALCATLLKPVEAGHAHARKGVFGWFNRVLEA